MRRQTYLSDSGSVDNGGRFNECMAGGNGASPTNRSGIEVDMAMLRSELDKFAIQIVGIVSIDAGLAVWEIPLEGVRGAVIISTLLVHLAYLT